MEAGAVDGTSGSFFKPIPQEVELGVQPQSINLGPTAISGGGSRVEAIGSLLALQGSLNGHQVPAGSDSRAMSDVNPGCLVSSPSLPQHGINRAAGLARSLGLSHIATILEKRTPATFPRPPMAQGQKLVRGGLSSLGDLLQTWSKLSGEGGRSTDTLHASGSPIDHLSRALDSIKEGPHCHQSSESVSLISSHDPEQGSETPAVVGPANCKSASDTDGKLPASKVPKRHRSLAKSHPPRSHQSKLEILSPCDAPAKELPQPVVDQFGKDVTPSWWGLPPTKRRRREYRAQNESRSSDMSTPDPLASGKTFLPDTLEEDSQMAKEEEAISAALLTLKSGLRIAPGAPVVRCSDLRKSASGGSQAMEERGYKKSQKMARSGSQTPSPGQRGLDSDETSPPMPEDTPGKLAPHTPRHSPKDQEKEGVAPRKGGDKLLKKLSRSLRRPVTPVDVPPCDCSMSISSSDDDESDDSCSSDFLGTRVAGKLMPPGQRGPDGLTQAQRVRKQHMMKTIMRFIGDRVCLEKEIRELFGNNPDTSKALRGLIYGELAVRHGQGGRGNPYVYHLTKRGRRWWARQQKVDQLEEQ